MTIDERLENISQQLEILTGLQHANERRFEESKSRFEEIGRKFDQVAKIFTREHESIEGLRQIAEAHEHRLDNLEG